VAAVAVISVGKRVNISKLISGVNIIFSSLKTDVEKIILPQKNSS
jgi:hypothetical protein